LIEWQQKYEATRLLTRSVDSKMHMAVVEWFGGLTGPMAMVASKKKGKISVP
jgi:hypothetical protein